jgi:peptidoglycan/LPS O-acetylase OafA/YrhL
LSIATSRGCPNVREGVHQSSRIAELDGLRGVAIFLVILWHYVGCLVSIPEAPLVSAMAKATHWAWSGVDLFFILSGFLIGGVLLDNRKSTNVMKVFYIRRACRILPLYFIMVAMFGIVVSWELLSNDWLFKGNIPIGSYLTFTQNFFMASQQTFGPNWLGITWSLAVEEQFYLAVPLIILVLPSHWLLAVLAVFIALAPVFRSQSGQLAAYTLPYCRADALLMGVAVAIIYRSTMMHCNFKLWRWLATTALLVAVPVLYALFLNNMFIPGGVVVHSLLAVAYASILLLTLMHSGERGAAFLRIAPALWLGTRSYGIYLLHQPVSGVMHEVFRRSAPAVTDVSSALVMLGAFAVTCVLAEISLRYFEQPFMAFGRSFKYANSHPIIAVDRG